MCPPAARYRAPAVAVLKTICATLNSTLKGGRFSQSWATAIEEPATNDPPTGPSTTIEARCETNATEPWTPTVDVLSIAVVRNAKKLKAKIRMRPFGDESNELSNCTAIITAIEATTIVAP